MNRQERSELALLGAIGCLATAHGTAFGEDRRLIEQAADSLARCGFRCVDCDARFTLADGAGRDRRAYPPRRCPACRRERRTPQAIVTTQERSKPLGLFRSLLFWRC